MVTNPPGHGPDRPRSDKRPCFAGKQVAHDLGVISGTALRELARRNGAGLVTSLYLDVDGRRFPRPSDYEPQVERLFREARAAAEQRGPEVTRAVEAGLARVRDYLDSGLDRSVTRGLALFAAEQGWLLEPFELSVPVRDQVVVGPAPDLAQLSELLATYEPILAVVVDRRRARLLRVELGGVEEHETAVDEGEHQVDTEVELGSFAHRHDEQLREHYRQAARAVTSSFDHQPACHVVLCGPPESVATVKGYLPDRVASRVRGRLSLPVATGQREVVTAATELVHESELRRQLSILEELRERVGDGVAAVAGLGPTLELLGQGRLSTLLVEEGFEAGGRRCPRCGRLSVDEVLCPVCGAAPVAVDNVVDLAVTEAFVHHVELQFCDPGQLADLGRIGAIERHGANGARGCQTEP